MVNKLCKFMSNPGDTHWQLLKHLLRYLKGTKHKGLLFDFSQPGTSGLHGYCDSSHADCPDSRHSTLAYVFRLGSAVLSWHSKLHSYVTSCTNHSEYAALFHAAKEAQWLVYLFQDLKLTADLMPIPIYIDSSGVVSMVFNPVDHQTNKHVEIAHHFSRELTEKRIITPQRLPSAEKYCRCADQASGCTCLSRSCAQACEHSEHLVWCCCVRCTSFEGGC